MIIPVCYTAAVLTPACQVQLWLNLFTLIVGVFICVSIGYTIGIIRGFSDGFDEGRAFEKRTRKPF